MLRAKRAAGEKRRHGPDGTWERNPQPSLEPALLAQSPGAAWKLRRTELVPCPSIGSTFTSSQPTVRPLSSVKCCLPVSQESFPILLLDRLLGTVPHLTAQDTHEHHLAPLAAPRQQSRLVVLDR